MSNKRPTPLAAIVAVVLVMILVTLACSTSSTAPTATPSGDQMMGTVEALFQATLTAQAEEPASTTTPVPAAASTSFKVPTANAMREWAEVVGWVTNDSGEFVQGAQVILKEDFALNTLDETYVLEVQCVHYSVKNGVVVAEPVCDGGKIIYSTNSIVLKGTIGTLWTSHVVVGSATETWPEGFLDKPCACADGDCRDE